MQIFNFALAHTNVRQEINVALAHTNFQCHPSPYKFCQEFNVALAHTKFHCCPRPYKFSSKKLTKSNAAHPPHMSVIQNVNDPSQCKMSLFNEV